MRTHRLLAFAALSALTLGLSSSPAVFAKDKPKPAAKLGKAAPDFELTDYFGKKHKLSTYTKAGKVVVLEWFNPGCPFVVKHHKHNRTMAKTYAKFLKGKKVVWLAINSGAKGKQGHAPKLNKKRIKDWKIKYPLLQDKAGKVGRLYGAKRTPHMYVIDAKGVLRYRGAIDNNPHHKTPGKVNYVDHALTAVLAGKKVKAAHTKAYGCSVKYGS